MKMYIFLNDNGRNFITTVFAHYRSSQCLRLFMKCKRKNPFLRQNTRVHSILHVSQKDVQTPKTNRWRVLFFGNDDFALESLKKLHNEYRTDKLSNLEVVTSAKGDRNVILKYIQENDLVAHTWPLTAKLDMFDIGIVVSFGHLIPSNIINSFPLGMINVHASLLPRWRGASPIIYALMNGDSETGVTVIKIAPKKFDIGEIIDHESVEIGPHETMPVLFSKLSVMGGDILVRTLHQLPGILSNAVPQSTSNVTYAPKINKSVISQINWNTMTAKNIYDLHRALTGICSVVAKFNGTSVKLLEIHPIETPHYSIEYQDHVPGTVVYQWSKKVLTIKCKGGEWIAVTRIGIPNRRVMSATDFNNGFISSLKRKYVVLE